MLDYYWQAFSTLDRFIWLVGSVLGLLHLGSLVYYLYRHWWRLVPVARFYEWRIMLLNFTEVLPLLGLLGTVIALLNTFYVSVGTQEKVYRTLDK